MDKIDIEIVYEDNHLLVVNKPAGVLVQGDATGDVPLVEQLKEFIKLRDHKPGNVFLGVTHRLDRPVSGLVVFAKTSKALSRINELFRKGEVDKYYWAMVAKRPTPNQALLEHYLWRNPKLNKSFVVDEGRKDAKLAKLSYTYLASIDRYHLLEVKLHTGRHHQIRTQLSSIGSPIKGDLKYGSPRSNPGGYSISLHARRIAFVHPVSKEPLVLIAEPPKTDLWHLFKVD